MRSFDDRPHSYRGTGVAFVKNSLTTETEPIKSALFLGAVPWTNRLTSVSIKVKFKENSFKLSRIGIRKQIDFSSLRDNCQRERVLPIRQHLVGQNLTG